MYDVRAAVSMKSAVLAWAVSGLICGVAGKVAVFGGRTSVGGISFANSKSFHRRKHFSFILDQIFGHNAHFAALKSLNLKR